jgi:CHAT domain-containing protein
VGFPAALAQAGVAGVVGALWSVNDLSTALLMMKFYELLCEDETWLPARALREAQQWLASATQAELAAACAQHPGLAEALPRLAREHNTDAEAPRPFANPYYWAGFIFVGL